MIITDIERAINDILGISYENKANPEIKPKRGRKALGNRPTWSLNFYEPDKNTTYAVISMCIKEDFDQTLDQLAARVSACKARPKAECLKILKQLSDCGKLGYYDDYTLRFRTWKGDV